MDNNFTYTDDLYHRELDPLSDYIEIQTFYLSRRSGRREEECKEYVISQIKPGGQFEFKDPKVAYLSREGSRDRTKANTTITEYIASARERDYIIVPSWSINLPSRVKLSLYTGYINATSAVRKKYKDAMFIAEQKENETEVKFNDGMQSSAKTSINSISGAALSPSTVNHTQSLHPALTSVCAASTSLANLNNEKLIAGNRIYTTYQTTLDNIISIVLRANMSDLQEAMDEFELHYPSVEETMACINKSTTLYWRDASSTNKILALVETLNPLERAAFVYIGDMYHLDKYNPRVVNSFLRGFTWRTTDVLPMDEADAIHKSADSDVAVLAKLLCKEYLMGTTLWDLRDDDPLKYGEVCANMLVIEKHLVTFQALIRGVFRPSFLNPGAHRYAIPNMLREAVLTSDTDSTIYTAQYWVERITGTLGFDDEHYSVGFAISFLVNKTVYHQLAMMSKNMGFETKDLHMISMKNEYYFPVYALTNQTKNYFAFISVREGNVYSKMKLEKKGVGLRSSKIPRNVMDKFDAHIRYLMERIIEVQNITLDELFSVPYETESMVRNSVLEGKSEYFQTAQIKAADSYKAGYNAPAQKLHRLWEHVFAEKYGEAPEIPYTALKISTGLTSAKKLETWINSIDDLALANRLRSYLKNEARKDLGTIYVPQMTIGFGTIPPEIVAIINVNKQLMNVMSSFYLALESFGFYLKNPNNTTMIHTHYKPRTDIKRVN